MSDTTNQREQERSLPERLKGFQKADRLFRAFMQVPVIARQFVQAFLPPDIVDILKDEDPVPMPTTFFDAELGESQCDVLLKIAVKSRESPRFYVLIEHKSHNDRYTSDQLDTYVHEVRKLDRVTFQNKRRRWKPPYVRCFVFYHGKNRWTAPRSMEGLVHFLNDDRLASLLPDGPGPDQHGLIDVLRHDIDATGRFPELTAMLQLLKGGPLDDLLPYLGDVPDRGDMLHRVNYFVLCRYKVFDREVAARIVSALWREPEEREKQMTSIIDVWLAEGETRGIAKGEAKLLFRLLEQKFGDLNGAVQERVSTASPEQLEQWGIRLLNAETLDELFGDTKST